MSRIYEPKWIKKGKLAGCHSRYTYISSMPPKRVFSTIPAAAPPVHRETHDAADFIFSLAVGRQPIASK